MHESREAEKQRGPYSHVQGGLFFLDKLERKYIRPDITKKTTGLGWNDLKVQRTPCPKKQAMVAIRTLPP